MNKHIVRDDDSTPFHSSGYAKAANGARMGSTNKISFEQRQRIDQNRRVVNPYRFSSLGRVQSEVYRAKTFQESQNTANPRMSLNPRLGKPNSNMSSSIQRNFSEPPKRTYNPYN